ncbi:uncharacterized protein LOC130441532 [Diorhabda sublineata]|uniref:uncharacterized protein LOC130441532 n=1 Tax=Diorhabda sublineata TaxID=1163346 RepID=UPI0024E09A34|nr:uncharacterized protein LOC130441532 [Diorhabda sublineata]
MGVEMINCCGFSLKHGTIIIGVVQSIFSFMFLVLAAAYAEHPNELIDISDISVGPSLTALRIALSIIALVSALECVFSILLIFGAETNRPKLLLPWLISNPVVLLAYILLTLMAIIHHTRSALFIIGHLTLGFFATFIASFKFLCVWSFYKHLKSLNF